MDALYEKKLLKLNYFNVYKCVGVIDRKYLDFIKTRKNNLKIPKLLINNSIKFQNFISDNFHKNSLNYKQISHTNIIQKFLEIMNLSNCQQ